eukprot:scaffold197285_cov22-Tisochrysis_lutea.AAC.2
MDNRQPKARTSTMLRYSGAGAANTQLGVFATVSADKNKYEAHVASSIPVPPPSDGYIWQCTSGIAIYLSKGESSLPTSSPPSPSSPSAGHGTSPEF